MASRFSRIMMTTGAAVMAASVVACSKDATTATPTSPSAPTITSVAVTGSAPTVGLTAQFSATATLSNGATQNVTSLATWQSSNSAVATINNAGVVTSVAIGEVDVTATYQSVAGRARILIVPASFSLSGVVTDATSGGVLPNINMQIVSGPNVGASTRTDGAGAYVLGVAPGATTLSASAAGYQALEKAVVVVGNTRLDFVLVRAPSCAYTLSTTSQNVPAAGGAFSFTATSNTADVCQWTASTGTPWLTLGATSGTSPGTIAFTAAANPTIAVRTGTIRVSWPGGFADSTVTQAAATCSFVLNPQSANPSAAGGTGAFTVTPSDAACAWTTTSDSSWLSILSGQNGIGPGTVTYSAQAYSGPVGPRVGSILVTGVASGVRAFPVTQQPPP